MAYVSKPKYSIEQAAEIISAETGAKHSVEDIYDIASDAQIGICLHKPEFIYVQTDTPDHEHCVVYCEPLKENIIIPKKRGKLSDIRKLYKASDCTIFPILRKVQVKELANYKPKKMKIRSFDLSATDNCGNLMKVARVYQCYAPTKGEKYRALMEWLPTRNIQKYRLEPDKSTPMDGTFISGTNRYYSLGDDFECLIFEVNVPDELCIPKIYLDRYINQNNKNEVILYNQGGQSVSSLKKLRLGKYSLSDALHYFEINNLEIRTKEHIFGLMNNGELQLSLEVKRAVLTSVVGQERINAIKTDPKSMDFSKNCEERDKLKKEHSIGISDSALKIVKVREWTEGRYFVDIVEYHGKQYHIRNTFSKMRGVIEGMYNNGEPDINIHESGKVFTDSTIIITNENLRNYLEGDSSFLPISYEGKKPIINNKSPQKSNEAKITLEQENYYKNLVHQPV